MSQSVFDRLYNLECKIAFATKAATLIMEGTAHNKTVINGYQQIMYSIEKELKEIQEQLDN